MAKISAHVFIGFAVVFLNGVYGFDKRCYYDHNDTASTFTLVLRQTFNAGATEQIIALDRNTSQALTNCTSVAVWLMNGTVHELVIKYDISTQTQTFPDPNTANCAVTYSPSTFRVMAAVQANTAFLQTSDYFYDVDCDTATADAGFTELRYTTLNGTSHGQSLIQAGTQPGTMMLQSLGFILHSIWLCWLPW